MSITIYEPKVEEFLVTVGIPMHMPIKLNQTNNIDGCEEDFIKMRDKWAKTEIKQRDYDRCRATIKWAKSCSASLKKVFPYKQKDKNYVKFRFAFGSMDAVNEFYDGLTKNVRSSIL